MQLSYLSQVVEKSKQVGAHINYRLEMQLSAWFCGNENGKSSLLKWWKLKSAFTTYFFAFPRLTQLPTPPLIALGAGIMFLCWVAAEVFSSQAYLLREGEVFEIFYFCCNFLRLYSCSVQLLTNCSLTPRGFSTTSKNTTFSLFSILNNCRNNSRFFALPHNRECVYWYFGEPQYFAYVKFLWSEVTCCADIGA